MYLVRRYLAIKCVTKINIILILCLIPMYFDHSKNIRYGDIFGFKKNKIFLFLRVFRKKAPIR